MKKIYTLLMLLAIKLVSFSQTLAPGDIALLGINASTTDKFSFIILKNIPAGTVIQFTDNGFSSATAGRTGEGFLTFTAAAAYTSGTIFTWTNGATTPTDFNSFNPSNFAFNASGDQLFIFQGATTDWATQTNITLLYGINYGAAILTTGAAAAGTTYAPTALASANLLNLPTSTANNGYYSGDGNSTSTISLNGTSAEVYTNLLTASKWFTQSSATTFPAVAVLLPLNIVSFDATKSTLGNMISFTTANELNVQYIIVERSSDGRNFSELQKLSAGRTNYQLVDASPINGTNYYRLKIVDKDGSFKLSKTIAVINNGKGAVVTGIYPTVSTGNIKVDLSTANAEQIRFVFTDVLGRTSAIKTVASVNGNSTISLDASNLAAGMYFIKVLQGNNQLGNYKIIKQ